MASTAKTRRRATGGHREIEELGGDFSSDNSPNHLARQREYIARRYGLTPHAAALVAEFAFAGGAHAH
jgi:hypothetical protein